MKTLKKPSLAAAIANAAANLTVAKPANTTEFIGLSMAGVSARTGSYKVPNLGFACGGNPDNPTINPASIASCREVFAKSFQPKVTTMFFNAGARHKVVNLAVFFKQLEDKLGIPNDKKSTFRNYTGGDKDSKGVAAVIVSSWWMVSEVRRQAFTIFLRCGTEFRGDFDAAVLSNNYAKATIHAIKYFMEGNTQLAAGEAAMEGANGWYSRFHSATPFTIRDRLVPPTA